MRKRDLPPAPTADLVTFYWRVPERGFEWIRPSGSPPTEWRLTLAGEPSVPCVWPPYVPESGLFLVFAEIELAPAADGILAFANRYGFLGSDPTRNTRLTQTTPKQVGSSEQFLFTAGEKLDDWVRELHFIKEAVTLWRALETSDADYLAGVISWRSMSMCCYHRPALADLVRRNAATTHEWSGPRPVDALGEHFVIASSDQPDLFARFQPGDLLVPGWYALQRLVNQQGSAHTCEHRMIWDFTAKEPRLRMQLVPTSLLAAMWLQLSSAIEGHRVYKQCRACGRWFAPAQDTRADATFCRRACRFKAYRKRQERACELAAQGKSQTAIATELKSDVQTVKGWLKKNSRSKARRKTKKP